jgi:hypothetical protein
MGNNIIRAEGKAKFAMVAMIIPYCQHYIRYYFYKSDDGWDVWRS